MNHLSKGLGQLDRDAGLKGYSTEVMRPRARKSVDLTAACGDPMRASARHQSLHHFLAKAQWSDRAMLLRACQWIVPQMDLSRDGWWVIDDTEFLKEGKQDNCEAAVSASPACDQGSAPLAWQRYRPEDWAADPKRRVQADVAEDVRFATNMQIARTQLRTLLAEGAPPRVHPNLGARDEEGADLPHRVRASEVHVAPMPVDCSATIAIRRLHRSLREFPSLIQQQSIARPARQYAKSESIVPRLGPPCETHPRGVVRTIPTHCKHASRLQANVQARRQIHRVLSIPRCLDR